MGLSYASHAQAWQAAAFSLTLEGSLECHQHKEGLPAKFEDNACGLWAWASPAALLAELSLSARMQYLGMSKPSSTKRGFLRRLLRDVEEHGEKKLELAGYDKLLGDPDYHELKQLTSLDVHEMLRRYMSKLHHKLDELSAGTPHRMLWQMQATLTLDLVPTASSTHFLHLLILHS